MAENQNEMKQLNSGFRIVLIIWGAIFASLGVYLLVAILIKDQLTVNIGPDFPLDIFKYALFGVSGVTLFAVHFLRRYMLRPGQGIVTVSSGQHPAVAKYTVAVLISAALSESIGIYGLVVFLMVQDSSYFYQMLFISAAALFYFRPKKDEFFDFVAALKMGDEE